MFDSCFVMRENLFVPFSSNCSLMSFVGFRMSSKTILITSHSLTGNVCFAVLVKVNIFKEKMNSKKFCDNNTFQAQANVNLWIALGFVGF